MIQTQLIRLDKPYNVICNNQGEFALHIATLLIVKENKGNSKVEVSSYPVVSKQGLDLEGKAWMDSELNDCMVVCREDIGASLHSLKDVMEFCAKHRVSHFQDLIPMRFDIALMWYGVKTCLPKDQQGNTIVDFEVPLVFEEGNDGNSCMVYSSNESPFYFWDYFSNDPQLISMLPTNIEVVNYIAEARDTYMRILHHEGLRSITFTTKDERYQWFVKRLNEYKIDE